MCTLYSLLQTTVSVQLNVYVFFFFFFWFVFFKSLKCVATLGNVSAKMGFN